MAATVALEVVRITGFRIGAMPGDLPRLMGVLILNRFAEGPGTGSDLAGWAYHFWNGAAFGIVLGHITYRLNDGVPGILVRMKQICGRSSGPCVQQSGKNSLS